MLVKGGRRMRERKKKEKGGGGRGKRGGCMGIDEEKWRGVVGW